MKLKEIDFKYIKIIFRFQDKKFEIQAEPYKTFSEIKQKVLNKFVDIPKNIHFNYLGRDLSKNGEEKIGTIFNHKENVIVILRLPKLKLKTIRSNLSSSEITTPDTQKHLSYSNTQLITLNNNKNLHNLKPIKMQDLEKKINDNSFINKRPYNKIKLSNSSSMPNLNLKKSINIIKINSNKNKYGYNNIHFNLNDINIYCDTHKYKVSEYCRTCKKFICPECRLSQKHQSHLTIRLNFKNLEESIKLYIMLVITNEKRNLDIINKNFFSGEDEVINEETLNKKKDSVNEECDKLIKNYNIFLKKLEKKINLHKKNYKAIIINTFNDIAQKISKQIGDILIKLDEVLIKRGKNLSITELKYYFDEIAKKEDTLNFIGDTTVKYLLTWEINRKIENTLDKIENTLDEIINEENLFNLDYKYNKEIMKYNINQKNENNDNNKKKTKGILKSKGKRRYGLIFEN